MRRRFCERQTRSVPWRCALLAAVTLAGSLQAACRQQVVATGQLEEIIAGIDAYDTAATTNQARFVADVLFALAARAPEGGDRVALRIEPARFMDAWLRATGTERADAPVSMRRVVEFDQHFVIDPAPEVRLTLPDGLNAPQVLAVRVGWAAGAGTPERYRYHDRLSDPDVLLEHSNDIRYLLLDFDGFRAYERVRGISGKPTSGGLGALFSVLGPAEMRSSRFAIAADGTQVNRTRVAKLFTFTALATVRPDGRASRGLPDGRADLEALAERLEAEYEVSEPSRWPGLCQSRRRAHSARRPAHLATAQQVQVDVPDRLPGAGIAIEIEPVAILGNALGGGDLGRCQHHAADQPGIVGGQIVERADPALGDDQHMHRRLRVDIAKRQQLVVFPHDVGGNLARDDLFEQLLGHLALPMQKRDEFRPDYPPADPAQSTTKRPPDQTTKRPNDQTTKRPNDETTTRPYSSPSASSTPRAALSADGRSSGFSTGQARARSGL